MSSLMTHGLSALMEACKQSERADNKSESLYEAFESAIDDDIIAAVTGSNVTDDSVEADMDGEGVNDEKMEKLLEKIPPSDETVSDDVEELVEESLIPIDEMGYVM